MSINSSIAKRWRRRVGAPIAVAVALIAGLLMVNIAGAVVVGATGSNFEILDGNTTLQNGAGYYDWDAPQSAVTVKGDLTSGSGDDSFTQGTKEDTAIPVQEYGSIPPNKSDLKEFGYTLEETGGAKFLHLFWTRVQDPSGTTNMDFEFNKNACVTGDTSGCSANGVTPTRSNNDLLITYDLSRGGTVPTISLRKWSASSGAWGPSQSLDASVATGSINNSAITTNINGTSGSYSARTFGEATINLAAIFNSNSCSSFGGAYLKSRSSDSFTAALKDFIAPVGVNLSNCGRVIVEKRAGTTTGALLSGATFSLSPANQATPAQTTVPEIGTTGRYCVDNLLIGTQYTITETAAPTGYNPDPTPQYFTPSAIGTCTGVTASTPANANLTFVNQRQTGSIRVKKVNASGTALGGAGFTITPGSLAMTAETSTGYFCKDGLTLDVLYTVTESTVPPGYVGASSQTFTPTTGSTCAGRTSATDVDLTFTNNLANGDINVEKRDDAGNLRGGATVVLYSGTTVVGQCTTSSIAGTGFGKCSINNVPVGSYTLDETAWPADTNKGSASVDGGASTSTWPINVTVDQGSTANTGDTVSIVVENPRRRFTTIVIVCEGNSLYQSIVTPSGGVGVSTTANPPAGVTATQLCATGGARFTNQLPNTYNYSVNIPTPT